MVRAEGEPRANTYAEAYAQVDQYYGQFQQDPENSDRRFIDVNGGRMTLSKTQEDAKFVLEADGYKATLSKTEGLESLSLPPLVFSQVGYHEVELASIDVTLFPASDRARLTERVAGMPRIATEQNYLPSVADLKPEFKARKF